MEKKIQLMEKKIREEYEVIMMQKIELVLKHIDEK